MPLQYLNLHGCAIKRICGLSACVSLEVLVLSFNSITKVEGLTPLSKLEKLDVSFNKIDGFEVSVCCVAVLCCADVSRGCYIDASAHRRVACLA